MLNAACPPKLVPEDATAGEPIEPVSPAGIPEMGAIPDLPMPDLDIAPPQCTQYRSALTLI